MILAHRIELKPNKSHTTAFRKACGVARFTWNWALEHWQKEYQSGGNPSGRELKKQYNQVKPDWVYESPKDANQQPFNDLQNAFNRFFKGVSKYPIFKTKGKCRDSFYISNGKTKVVGKRVRLPKIGWVRMMEALRFEGKIMSATVSREADRWFISIHVEIEPVPEHGDEIIGVDLGVRTAVTLSTGEKFEGPKSLRKGSKELEKLQRLGREVDRKQKGSKNRQKAVVKLARQHRRIANIRKDFLHKTTSTIVSRAKTVIVEDLSVEGMYDGVNRGMRRAIADTGMGEVRRQLTYKCQMNEAELHTEDRYFPSTRLCNDCGTQNHVGRNQTIYKCHCGYIADRDVNAAKNLRDRWLGGLCLPSKVGTDNCRGAGSWTGDLSGKC